MKQSMMKGDLKGAQAVNEMIEEIKKRYEIESLVGLRNRESSLHQELKELSQTLKESNVLQINQQVKLE